MSVWILGNNNLNAEVERCVVAAGMDAVVADGVDRRNAVIDAVIITEPPRIVALGEDGAEYGLASPTTNLMDDAEVERVESLKTNDKIAILLDYGEETPEYIAAKAIRTAKRFAGKKKEVVFLSKVVKCGYGGGEQEYLAARDAGVVFVKYEEASISYDEEADSFTIKANDGVLDMEIETPYVLSAVVRDIPELEKISKKLRLYKRADGRVNDDRFFLHPAFSTRRGVYYLNPALVAKGSERDAVQRVMLSVIADIKAAAVPGYEQEIVRRWGIPEVDAGKCAFCYSCYRACTHGAFEPDAEASAMKVVEGLCQACGTCVAICPGEAIARKGGGDLAMTGDVSKKIKVYCCENGAAEAFDGVLPSLGEYAGTIDSERVACGGSVSADILANDFIDYDTIIIACCIEDACRHMDGDRRACKQAERATELFQKASIDGKRAIVIQASHAMENVMKDKLLSILEG
ncbi:MAG: hydrogenase iron-sulfur subunit [Clostridiales bacterium]|nr:hydrogenase iron-sulfur subunit [Clostridiales bacterium]